MNERVARGELRRQQPSHVGVERQVRHRAVTAGQVDRVVVLEADVRQLERPPHHLGRTDDGLQLEGSLLAARHRGTQAHHVDVRGHAVGRPDHDLVAGVGERSCTGSRTPRPSSRWRTSCRPSAPSTWLLNNEEYLRHHAFSFSSPPGKPGLFGGTGRQLTAPLPARRVAPPLSCAWDHGSAPGLGVAPVKIRLATPGRDQGPDQVPGPWRPGGVLLSQAPFLKQTSSRCPGELAVPVTDQEPEALARVPSRTRCPRPGSSPWVRVQGSKSDPAQSLGTAIGSWTS